MSGNGFFWVSLIGAFCSTTAVATLEDPPLAIGDGSADIQPVVAQVAIVRQAERAVGQGVTTVTRARDGMFYLDAKINNASVRLLIDTGSNALVLRPEDAERAGLDGLASDGSEMQTAGGSVPMRRGTASRVLAAGRELRNVDVVVPLVGPHVSLLGLGALRQLGTMLIDDDRIVFRHEAQQPSGDFQVKP